MASSSGEVDECINGGGSDFSGLPEVISCLRVVRMTRRAQLLRVHASARMPLVGAPLIAKGTTSVIGSAANAEPVRGDFGRCAV